MSGGQLAGWTVSQGLPPQQSDHDVCTELTNHMYVCMYTCMCGCGCALRCTTALKRVSPPDQCPGCGDEHVIPRKLYVSGTSAYIYTFSMFGYLVNQQGMSSNPSVKKYLETSRSWLMLCFMCQEGMPYPVTLRSILADERVQLRQASPSSPIPLSAASVRVDDPRLAVVAVVSYLG